MRIVLAVALLTPTIAAQAPIPIVQGNDLSDAIAEQQRLNQLIADQKRQLARLASMQLGLNSQIASTTQNLAGVRNSLDQAQAQVDDLKTQVAAVQVTYDDLARQDAALQDELAQLQSQQTQKQAELVDRQATLANRLIAAYQTQQMPLLQQMLTAHSLTDVLSDVSYYVDLGEADKALADQIEQDKVVLDELAVNVATTSAATHAATLEAAAQKAQLDDEVAKLGSAEAQLASLQSKLEKQLAQQKDAETKLDQNKVQLAAALKSNGQALDSLGTKIDKLLAEQGPGKIPSQYSGTLQWPMGGVVTQNFGCTGVLSEPPVGNCAHFHQGIDIAAPCLTPVHAAGDGVVIFVGYNPYDAPPQAWLVIIAHSTSMVTWYAHMTGKAPPGIRVGAKVVAGQLVGTENTTGHSSGCHLHWAVRVNGRFVNPRLFL
jgi:murein DD-endopeptidase MepM/ murein hydrolase activator NlpD